MTNRTPPPPVTYAADMVLFAEMEETTASVLLIKRGGKTFHGYWAPETEVFPLAGSGPLNPHTDREVLT